MGRYQRNPRASLWQTCFATSFAFGLESGLLVKRVWKIGPRSAELGGKAFLTLGRAGKGVL